MTGESAPSPKEPTPQTPTPSKGGGRGEALRAKYGVTVVLAGLGVLLGAFIASLIAFTTAADVSGAIAPVTTAVGTIVGAYFGVQVGASGKEESEAARTKAEDQAKALAAVAPGEDALKIVSRSAGWEGGPPG